MEEFNYKKYIVVFVITLLIFVTAFMTSTYFNDRKLMDIKATEDKISIGILSLETQFELLQESTCASLNRSAFAEELSSLAGKLSYAETNNDIPRGQAEDLKKYYFLLEIQDYLLMKKVSAKCKFDPVTIMYFYKTTECDDCEKQGYVLTHLRETYPRIRVYTIDYNIDLPAVKTLIDMHKVKEEMPALIINGKVHQGFQSLEEMEKILEPLLEKDALSATTTTDQTRK